MGANLIRRTALLRSPGPHGRGPGTMLVRRLSPYALPGVFLWLVADDSAVGDGNPDGAPVNRIAGGPVVAQETGSAQPLLRVGAANGRSYWEFDGVNDHWTFTDTREPLTVYLVGKTRRTENGNAWPIGWKGSGGASGTGVDMAINLASGSGRFMWNDTADGFDRAELAGPTLDTYVVLSARRNGTALKLWRSNSATAGTATHTGTLIGIQGDGVIGARYAGALPGALSAYEQLNLIGLVACDQPHSDTLRQQMSRILAAHARLTDVSPL